MNKLSPYETRVRILESEGMTRSDAQAVADAENMKTIERLREIKAELLAERISYGELAEIDELAEKYRINVTDEMLAEDVIEAIELNLETE